MSSLNWPLAITLTKVVLPACWGEGRGCGRSKEDGGGRRKGRRRIEKVVRRMKLKEKKQKEE